eukprot:1898408-Prymnesium_polylepis.1
MGGCASVPVACGWLGVGASQGKEGGLAIGSGVLNGEPHPRLLRPRNLASARSLRCHRRAAPTRGQAPPERMCPAPWSTCDVGGRARARARDA